MLSLKLVSRKVPDIKVLLYREVHRQNKNYYDALGLTPKASKSDIKNAYYKMSMVYHPDKGADNSVKFQEISTAYEVLGNNKLRKMYDEGRLPTSPSKFAEEKESVRTSKSTDTSTGSRESKARQQQQHYENFNANNFDESARSKGPHTGRTEQYDFDAWTKAHYSETFARQENRKAARRQKKIDDMIRSKKLENIVTTVFVFTVVYFIYLGMTIHSNDYQHRYKPMEPINRRSTNDK